MDKDFLLRVFERIGVPLMAAVKAVSAAREKEGQAPDLAEQARHFSELLSETIEVGNVIAMDLTSAEENGPDTLLRLRLSEMAASVAGAHFTNEKRLMSDKEKEGVSSLFNTLRAFASYFSDDDTVKFAGEERRKGPNSQELLLIEALVPVADVVADFSFGRNGQMILSEVTQGLLDRLEYNIKKWKKGPFDSLPDEVLTNTLINAVSQIYVICHHTETQRVKTMNEDSLVDYYREKGEQSPLIPVWKAFDTRMNMLYVLVARLSGKDVDLEERSNPFGGPSLAVKPPQGASETSENSGWSPFSAFLSDPRSPDEKEEKEMAVPAAPEPVEEEEEESSGGWSPFNYFMNRGKNAKKKAKGEASKRGTIPGIFSTDKSEKMDGSDMNDDHDEDDAIDEEVERFYRMQENEGKEDDEEDGKGSGRRGGGGGGGRKLKPTPQSRIKPPTVPGSRGGGR